MNEKPDKIKSQNQQNLESNKKRRIEKIAWPLKKNIVRANLVPTEVLFAKFGTCRIGDGKAFERLTIDSTAKIFEGLLDHKEILVQEKHAGGYSDIEFSFLSENLEKFPCFKPLFYRYNIKSVIVEAKNLKCKAGHEDATQIADYLRTAKKGNFGLIVSRNGFTKNALERLSSYAKNEDILILPLAEREIRFLLRLRIRHMKHVYRYLRIIETRLGRF
jgi:hypothetical protein